MKIEIPSELPVATGIARPSLCPTGILYLLERPLLNDSVTAIKRRGEDRVEGVREGPLQTGYALPLRSTRAPRMVTTRTLGRLEAPTFLAVPGP